MTDPKLDAKLKAFLESSERDRAEGNTIANLRLEVGQCRSDIGELTAEQRLMKLRLDRHGRDIREIKQRIDWGDELDTGQHQVDDLRRALATKEAELQERKAEGLWWKRSAVKWVAAGVGWLAASILMALGAYVIAGKK